MNMFLVASVFRQRTPKNKHLVSSFNKKNDQCIKAHLFHLFMFLLASVLRAFTPQHKHLVSSFNKKNDRASRRIFVVFVHASFGFSMNFADLDECMQNVPLIFEIRSQKLKRWIYDTKVLDLRNPIPDAQVLDLRNPISDAPKLNFRDAQLEDSLTS